MYNLTWKEFSLRCQGLLMKYQRLSVLSRQISATIINTTPGQTEPVEPEDIFLTAFDDLTPPPERKKYTTEEWQTERERVIAKMEKHGKN